MVDLAKVEFAENPEPRCPCVLLLDTSGSMGGTPIASLNEGLKTFATSLMGDPLAAKRVEVAVVTFDSTVRVVQEFITADQFQPPTLSADGGTDMASGIMKALDIIEARKTQYKSNGIAYYRPWVFMITDGAPNAGYEAAAQRIKSDEQKKRVAFFTVGVEGANMELLEQVAARKPLRLLNLNFNEMFVWLSTSMQRVSQSKPEDQVPLPAAGWGAV
jgi:uncharacterized protein YegL